MYMCKLYGELIFKLSSWEFCVMSLKTYEFYILFFFFLPKVHIFKCVIHVKCNILLSSVSNIIQSKFASGSSGQSYPENSFQTD